MSKEVTPTYLGSRSPDQYRRVARTTRSASVFALSLAVGMAAWQLISLQYSVYFFPSPAATWIAFRELADDGTLAASTMDSARRILIGWTLGLLVGVPIGLV